MKSLKELSRTTDSYNVLISIEHAILGYTRENAGCIKSFLPFEYTVDLTMEELKPEYKRVNEIREQRWSKIPIMKLVA